VFTTQQVSCVSQRGSHHTDRDQEGKTFEKLQIARLTGTASWEIRNSMGGGTRS